jgi:hypothetical protein
MIHEARTQAADAPLENTRKGKISTDEQKITTGVPNQEPQAQIHRRHNQNNGKHNLDAKNRGFY